MPNPVGGNRDSNRQRDDDRRVSEREEKSDGDGPPPFLHELAGDVVDRRDVVGVDRMAQPERVREQRRSEENRAIGKRDEGQHPARDVEGYQDGIDSYDAMPYCGRRAGKDVAECGDRKGPSHCASSEGWDGRGGGCVVPCS